MKKLETGHKGRTYNGRPVNRAEGIDRDPLQTPRRIAKFGEPMSRAAVLAEWKRAK